MVNDTATALVLGELRADPGRWRTCPDLAVVTGLPPREVADVLAGLVAGGVLVREEQPFRPARYRVLGGVSPDG